MAEYQVMTNPDKYVVCPYDPSHTMPGSTLQAHLVGCRQRNAHKKMMICPFNAKHHIPLHGYRFHKETCPDKALIEKEYIYDQEQGTRRDNRVKGYTETPVYRDLDIDMDEDWDSDLSGREPAFTSSDYDRVQFREVSDLARGQSSAQRWSASTADSLRLPNTPSLVTMGAPCQPRQVSSGFVQQAARGRGRAAARLGVAGSVLGAADQHHPSNTLGSVQVSRGRGVVPSYSAGVGRGALVTPAQFIVPKVQH